MEKVRVKIGRLAKFFLIVGLAGFVLAAKTLDDGRFHVYFFDVGQGDSILIKTPESYEVLIDGGPKTKVLTELNNALGFFDRSLDMVILTHPHADHVAGLTEVLKKYKVGAVMLTGVIYKNGYYDEFIRQIKEQKIPIVLADENSDFTLGSVFFDVLYPFKKIAGEEAKNLNNSSIVLRVKYKETALLFTGDAEKEIESMLVKHGAMLRSQILKVAHHGSKTSSTPAFLASVGAEIAVIQCGIDNMFGHPSQQTLDNLEMSGVKQIYRNDLDGSVELSF